MMRRMRGAGGEVHEKGFVGHERLLLAHPFDRLVGQIFGEVVALLRGLLWLDRRGAFIQRGIVLVGFATDESIEIFETTAARRPALKRSQRTGFPDGHFMAFAELRG